VICGLFSDIYTSALVKAWEFKLPAGSLNSQFHHGRLNLRRSAGIRGRTK
jgi:hypothetical protein